MGGAGGRSGTHPSPFPDDFATYVSDTNMNPPLHPFPPLCTPASSLFPPTLRPPSILGRFKTKGGRDLAVGRSGEGLGSSEPYSPYSVPVLRGRNEGGDDGGGDVGFSPNDLMVVLKPGCSVAEVLGKVSCFCSIVSTSPCMAYNPPPLSAFLSSMHLPL